MGSATKSCSSRYGIGELNYTVICSPLVSSPPSKKRSSVPVVACRSKAAVAAFPAAMPIIHARQLAPLVRGGISGPLHSTDRPLSRLGDGRRNRSQVRALDRRDVHEATETLEQEHRVIEQVASACGVCAEVLRRGAQVPADVLESIVDFFRQYGNRCSPAGGRSTSLSTARKGCSNRGLPDRSDQL